MTGRFSRLIGRLIGWATVLAAAASTVLFFFGPKLASTPGLTNIPQRLGLTLLFVVGAYGLLRLASAHARRGYLTSWWDPAPARADGPLSWDQVLQLVSGTIDCDPLEHQPKIRPWPLQRWIIGYVLVLIGLLLATSLPFALILDPSTLSQDGSTLPPRDFLGGGAINPSGNFTAYLALTASLITAAFTYQLLRARVRADNRQKWIARARRLLGEVTALLAAHEHEGDRRRRDNLWLRCDPLRLELELMLNPSEKDHRLLLYLIQRLAFLGWKDSKETYFALQDKIQDAVNVRRSILRASPHKGTEMPIDPQASAPDRKPDLGCAWNEVLYCDNAVELISYILRLSHVVLKREWERVKHTR